jgi:membrane protein implicated in regulation of membrane protease activity
MYRTQWIATPVVLGAVLLPLIAPPFALIALAVVALAVLAALVALAGAVLATPYLLVRSLRRHLAERRRSRPQGGSQVGSVSMLRSY